MAGDKKAVIVRRVDLKVVVATLSLLEHIPTARLYGITPKKDEIMMRAQRKDKGGGFVCKVFPSGGSAKAERKQYVSISEAIEALRNVKLTRIVLVNDALNKESKPELTLWTDGKSSKSAEPKKDAPEKAVKPKTSKKAAVAEKPAKEEKAKPKPKAASKPKVSKSPKAKKSPKAAKSPKPKVATKKTKTTKTRTDKA